MVGPRPFAAADRVPAVLVAPAEVFGERLGQLINRAIGVASGGEHHPVGPGQRVWQLVPVRHLTQHDGNDELVQLHGLVELMQAFRGARGLGRDDEDECLRRVDAAIDALCPVRGGLDLLPVYPDPQTPGGQVLLELIDERDVQWNAAIGNERVKAPVSGRVIQRFLGCLGCRGA